MQQPTNLQPYAYWDRVRNGRFALVALAKIVGLLPETFIAAGPACRRKTRFVLNCLKFSLMAEHSGLSSSH
jgi:hypothetical protein